ncbi:F-box protein SKIP19-like isoform X2 [Andrographis paniculata]|uniref:F-box protein SKIP19-like isoform X2 n=1 Tax=Andrographis paniculata TaxID=175694 RepID=UPI0021E8A522|nr:F-box protein SKIP19-like isoform X2 [Andrographis paniculata]
METKIGEQEQEIEKELCNGVLSLLVPPLPPPPPPPPPSPPTPPPPWIELPDDVTINILQRLDVVEILESAQRVCTSWWRICKHPSMWTVIDMEDYWPYNNSEIACREAVGRSQGQLIDISIEFFGTPELICYISERCSQLKRLKLLNWSYKLTPCLQGAFRKFSALEELYLLCNGCKRFICSRRCQKHAKLAELVAF